MAIDIPKKLVKKTGAGAPNFTTERPLYPIPLEALTENGYPTVDEKGVRTTGNFVFKAGQYPDELYLTSSTKDYSVETTGEQDAERFKLKVMGMHPGDSTEATEYAVNNLGKPFILVAGKCDGGKTKIIGDICNPLYLKPTFKANKDKTGFEFTWEQSEGSRFMHREYEGTLPTIDSLTPVQSSVALQFLVENPNVVKIAVGSAATVAAVTSVTKAAGQIVTLVGQDTDAAKAATLSSATVFTGGILVILAGGVDWKSISGSTISFRIVKDGTKTYLIETSRA